MDKKKTKIILDCDPGIDDAVAIIMAIAHPDIELLGITVSAGNQTLEKTSRNAIGIVEYLNKGNIRVYPGCRMPMVREKLVTGGDIHGDNGLGGVTFENNKRDCETIHAVEFIRDTIMKSEEKITLVATGPLTNIAMALKMYPEIAEKTESIVLMGGAYGEGNVTASAEFNIYADPEAAYVVAHSDIPKVWMTLDMTNTTKCTPEVIERMKRINTPGADLFVRIMSFYSDVQKKLFGYAGGPLHDPTCLAYLIDRNMIETRKAHVDIDIRSEISYGRTVVDFRGRDGSEFNSDVSVSIDNEKFWNLVEDCLKRS